ncbi:MAG: deoxyribose-phosphate aldolase, partial [Planctomycetota bacterium]
MDQKELIDKITSEVISRLKAEMGGPSTGQPVLEGPPPSSLAKYIDHTMLRPEAPDAAFDQLCAEAVEWGFHSVCVNSSRARYVAQKLQRTNVAVCTVIGFPLGAMHH